VLAVQAQEPETTLCFPQLLHQPAVLAAVLEPAVLVAREVALVISHLVMVLVTLEVTLL
jgi:hypothetical protein